MFVSVLGEEIKTRQMQNAKCKTSTSVSIISYSFYSILFLSLDELDVKHLHTVLYHFFSSLTRRNMYILCRTASLLSLDVKHLHIILYSPCSSLSLDETSTYCTIQLLFSRLT